MLTSMMSSMLRRLPWLVPSLATAILIALATPASAQVIGAYVNTPNQRTDGGKVVGASFLSFGGTISSLGFYDHLGDGLATSYQVGLWDSSQVLLATATVTPTSPLVGDFRYAPI